MRVSRRWKWILGIAALLLAVAACWFGWGALNRRDYEERLAAVRGSELHARVEAWLSKTVPDEENAAPLVAEAHRLYEEAIDRGDWDVRYEWEESWTAESRADILRGLEKLDPALEMFEKACERPVYRRPEEQTGVQPMGRLLALRARFRPRSAPSAVGRLLALAEAHRPSTSLCAIFRGIVREHALEILHRAVAEGSLPEDAPTGLWLRRIETADTLDEFPFEIAVLRAGDISVHEAMLRGEDPFAEARETFAELEEALEGIPREKTGEVGDVLSLTPGRAWYSEWYARPLACLAAAEMLERWEEALDHARSEAAVRRYAANDEGPWMQGVFRHKLRRLAVLRLARTALVVYRGGKPPELANPFTGGPIEVRREPGRLVIGMEVPEWGRPSSPELWEWTVPLR